ncbi:histone deacetylase [Sphingomonas sp. CGMCC 1.13654]|uniref:Histone deacetylase n=1 Tax=Sphingomonas chungangi TaxID=2683589 RepID=A0A838L957_9SPHN|nr:histone deacetylase [Sphingomonas chungangi]MBA2935724.1 histone deacetylase [Sphingomonas chungangi]MVW54414.1 histone deacetylase [Sphingomonas chungangi]
MLHFVHHPDYVAPGAPGTGMLFDKYGLVPMALDEMGAAYEVHHPDPMPRRWIEAVHDPDYVEEVLICTVSPEKQRRIGFPIGERVARRAVMSPGGTWLAARLALRHGFAANGAGGSHHALYDTGAGYCVFNDLVIAANRLIAEGTVRRILIVDLDVHQGDGTAALTAGRDDIVTFSMHGEKNFPARKAVSDLDVALADGTSDADYLAVLAQYLPSLIDDARPDLIFYQAGVDPHGEDRLGRLDLSDVGLEARDRFVMASAARQGIPLASVLGGGYGNDRMAVARRHARTMLTLADEHDRAAASFRH